MAEIHAPVSPGELIDKITILEIKKERIDDQEKRRNVEVELSMLESLWDKSEYAGNPLVTAKRQELKAINEELWDIEDDLRLKESQASFEKEFVELARSVYFTNDRRAKAKKDINVGVGSALVEEKSYQDYARDE